MDALSKDGNFIKGFSVGNPIAAHFKISHFLFTNDTLIFCGADPNQLWPLMVFLFGSKLFLVLRSIWGNLN